MSFTSIILDGEGKKNFTTSKFETNIKAWRVARGAWHKAQGAGRKEQGAESKAQDIYKIL
ncbi:MAG TPA: hypothetical protein VFC92_01760 [Bacteroidales bacterium]|nr:hypothetical protein [Bacteroidales bacterium]